MNQQDTLRLIVGLCRNPGRYHTRIGPHRVNCLDLMLAMFILALMCGAFLVAHVPLGYRMMGAGISLGVFGPILWQCITGDKASPMPGDTDDA